MGGDGDVTAAARMSTEEAAMKDTRPKRARKKPVNPRPENEVSGVVAELAGLLAGVKVEEKDYEEYLAKKYS